MKRIFKYFLIFTSLYGVGFAYYFSHANKYSSLSSIEQNFDATVVFTGGSKRIEHVLERVKGGDTSPILITGVDESVSADVLLKDLSEDQRENITLDYMAKTTRDNVAVAKAWVADLGVDELLLVTSHYHMPRSEMLFKQSEAMFLVVPDPVYPDNVPVDFWLREYNKYILSSLRLM